MSMLLKPCLLWCLSTSSNNDCRRGAWAFELRRQLRASRLGETFIA